MKGNRARVYLDSCCIIDMVAADAKITTKENRDDVVWYYRQFLKAGLAGDIEIYTSYLTIVECRHIKDHTNTQQDTAETRRLFNSILLSGKSGIMAVEPTISIIECARSLTWDHDITTKPFDSLHIATALEFHCSEFITTDTNSIKTDDKHRCNGLGLSIINATETKKLPEVYRQIGVVFDEEKTDQ